MIRVADEIWVATALLHLEHPDRPDFSIQEIVDRAVKENLAGRFRPGLPIHAVQHCVATKRANPADHRILSETGRGRRRLFREGDPFHPQRSHGRVRPNVEDLPPRYASLISWYEREYRNGHRLQERGEGTPGSSLLGFFAVLSPDAASAMEKALSECERVDANEW